MIHMVNIGRPKLGDFSRAELETGHQTSKAFTTTSENVFQFDIFDVSIALSPL